MADTTKPTFQPPPAGTRIEQHAGDRGSLRALFAMAEDSGAQLDAYIDAGRVLVALRFYQRLGFRMREIERDAFTAARGYGPGSRIDGIELRDRVWLDRELER